TPTFTQSVVYTSFVQSFILKYRGTVTSLGVTDAIGNVFSGTELKGKPAAAMKMVVDNRSLFLLGGPKVLLKKGKKRLSTTIFIKDKKRTRMKSSHVSIS